MLLRIALGGTAAGIAALGLATATPDAQQIQGQRPQGFITGTVESGSGREAGVWVIAETDELATRFAKIVVTADDGRFVLPELPNATYNVWVRGYGLVDSAPVKGKPGQTLNLKATVARTPAEAAKVYPANYWYAMLDTPKKSEFPGTGAEGNGISTVFRTQAQFVDQMKQGCQLCHQIGNQLTRTLTHMNGLGFKSSVDAWEHRLKTGQRGVEMDAMVRRMGPRAVKMFADWTDRIAAGELPATAPKRPDGVEQNVVVTMWDWGNSTSYMHDEITTAKSNPRLNAGGPVYAVDAAHGKIIIVNPVESQASEVQIPTRDDPKTMRSRFPSNPLRPSNFWGNEAVHAGVSDPHNPMMDSKGRVWTTSTVSQGEIPAWCKDASMNKYAAYFPAQSASNRQASYYDPKTNSFKLIYTCFGTHHLQFAEDADETLYFSGGNQAIPWINTRLYDKTGDEVAAGGWCPTVIDTNGDGKITKPWNQPVGGGRSQNEGGGGGITGQFDPKLDTRVNLGSYGLIANPKDHSVWVTSTNFPGKLVRLDKGSNPPETCISEVYQSPDPENAFGPRGMDVDRNGVIWVALSGSGGLASFDRTRCKIKNGPNTVNGDHCPEGWTIYPLTVGPQLRNTTYNADYHYYNWVDQFNTSGLGENLPIANGSGSDSLLVLKPGTKEWIRLQVPYPMGFYSRGLDGRIDDPNAGWKGRGLWANYGTNFLWHIEGGKGTKSKMVHFQVRPDPLAR
jgi:hypothetical protein